MKSYFRIMLGRKSIHAEECLAGNFVGADFGLQHDLSGNLPDEWRAFNQQYIPLYLAAHPGKSKISAGLACGFLWTITKGMKSGDVALCPDGSGRYRLAEIAGDYVYQPSTNLPHRRPVRWLPQVIDRDDMSDALRNSTGSIGTVSEVTKYRDEIERLIGPTIAPSTAPGTPPDNPAFFAMEKHLEHFLEANWQQTEFGKDFNLLRRRGASRPPIHDRHRPPRHSCHQQGPETPSCP